MIGTYDAVIRERSHNHPKTEENQANDGYPRTEENLQPGLHFFPTRGSGRNCWTATWCGSLTYCHSLGSFRNAFGTAILNPLPPHLHPGQDRCTQYSRISNARIQIRIDNVSQQLGADGDYDQEHGRGLGGKYILE